METKFGWKSFFAETPRIVRRVRSAIIYTLVGSLTMAESCADYLGISIEDYTFRVAAIILLTRGLSSLFGVTDEDKDIINQKNQNP